MLLEEALEETTFGPFQLTLGALLYFVFTCGSLSQYTIPIYLLQPRYKCADSEDSTEWEECKPQDFCGTSQVWKIKNSQYSLDNWVE